MRSMKSKRCTDRGEPKAQSHNLADMARRRGLDLTHFLSVKLCVLSVRCTIPACFAASLVNTLKASSCSFGSSSAVETRMAVNFDQRYSTLAGYDPCRRRGCDNLLLGEEATDLRNVAAIENDVKFGH